jgi:uncharacterized repeat protein (TIGR03803 family)
MRRANLSYYAISSCVAAALLAGCGGSQPPIGAPGALPQTSGLAARANRTRYKILYSFSAGGSDGAIPEAPLIDVDGTLYGTTLAGGGGPSSCSSYAYKGCGTVFSVTLGGTEKVVHSFAGGDGSNPVAGLIDVGGTLYGTTSGGGAPGTRLACYPSYYVNSCGTVFSITPSGAEEVLHSFGQYPDGAYPFAGLIDVKGTLYGTTSRGGKYCGFSNTACGTVFSITPAGTEKVLYSFRGRRDGLFPHAGLVDVSGKLYGTTYEGGGFRGGTLFRIAPGGNPGSKVKILHAFGSGSDGARPNAELIDVNGTLYGTTQQGGAFVCGPTHSSKEYCGTVFSIAPDGTETVLHSFGEGADGVTPVAPLIELKGKLYGTTASGGTTGMGTVFSITLGGTEKVLHSFGAGSDGAHPRASLIDVNGTLYGTTALGGTYNTGTVFALKP